ACPSTAFCAGIDDQGNAVTSTDPLGGSSAWSITNIELPGRLRAISCPSETLCVATDEGVNAFIGTAAHASHTLTVSIAGAGTGKVTGPGIACPPTCSHAYESGEAVSLSATPGAGSSFTGWSGGGCSGTGACEVAMSADRDVTATFS